MLDGVLTAIAVQIDNSEANTQVRELRREAVWSRQRVEELVRICMKTKQKSTESYPHIDLPFMEKKIAEKKTYSMQHLTLMMGHFVVLLIVL